MLKARLAETDQWLRRQGHLLHDHAISLRERRERLFDHPGSEWIWMTKDGVLRAVTLTSLVQSEIWTKLDELAPVEVEQRLAELRMAEGDPHIVFQYGIANRRLNRLVKAGLVTWTELMDAMSVHRGTLPEFVASIELKALARSESLLVGGVRR
jgi:hypothetical protein